MRLLADAGRGVITDNGIVIVGCGEEMICIEPIYPYLLISHYSLFVTRAAEAGAADSCLTYIIY